MYMMLAKPERVAMKLGEDWTQDEISPRRKTNTLPGTNMEVENHLMENGLARDHSPLPCQLQEEINKNQGFVPLAPNIGGPR